MNEGDRIGIVGRNGDGKSSLLGMLAGIREPDGGRVTVRGGVTVGVLDQQDTLDDDDTIGHAWSAIDPSTSGRATPVRAT